MKHLNRAFVWTLSLIVAGAFLLLKNLGVLDPWGDVAWGGIFAVAGAGFLIDFAVRRDRSWRAIPGFTLLSIGAIVLLQWRGIDLGNWTGPLVLIGIALGFWAMLAAQRDSWWAVIPAGALTVVGILTGLGDKLSPLVWNSMLFIGLGLVFGLLYVLRLDENDTRWAAIPAAALVLYGIVTLFSGLAIPASLVKWWPALLIVAGVVGLALATGLRRRPAPVAPTPEPYDAIEPAHGATVVGELPDAPEPESTPALTQSEPPDIYTLLEQQPAEEPEPDSPETPMESS